MAAVGRPKKSTEEPQAMPVKKTTMRPSTLTPEENAIFQRVKSAGQRREWETISEEDVHDYSLSKDPFKIPEFAKKLEEEKVYKFRWIERTKERIDAVNSLEVPFKWWLVTAETVPESANDIDPNLGCVTRLDQMLVFKPYWMFEKQRQIVERTIEDKDKAKSLEAKHGQPVDSTGSEYVAGRRAQIHGSDSVILHEGDIDEETGSLKFDPGNDGDLGDILTDEE